MINCIMEKWYDFINMFEDREIFWNVIIRWCLKHIHRAGGLHQNTFYDVLEKSRKDSVKAMVRLFEEEYHGEGWD